MKTLIVRSSLFFSAAFCWGLGLAAQSDIEANAAVQFNFSIPGARSLAMGGAFIASADDATAAYSNPAGLLRLTKPEVSLEARRWNYEVPFAARGRASGTPTGIGVDTINGVQLGTAKSEVEGMSFASVVFPRPKWVAALSYNQLANFHSDFRTAGIFAGNDRDEVRRRPVISTYDLDVSQLGLSFAYKWKNGVALGVTVSANELELDSFTQRYQPRSFRSEFDPALDFPINFQRQDAKDQALGGSVGLRWDSSDRLSVGMVYRHSPRFDLQFVTSTLSPGIPIPPREEAIEKGSFDLPDTAGIGIAYHPGQRWTLSLDYQKVYYTDFLEGFVVLLSSLGVSAVPDDFKVDDVEEIHVGAEYVIDRLPVPIALRCGAWLDPDHRLRAETGPILNQATFYQGEDTIHTTAGLGLVFASHFQLDAAIDLSDLGDTASISGVFRF